jgi:ATP/ADP translocase
MNVAMMVVSYGLTMEFTEIMWKSTVKKGGCVGGHTSV